MKHSFPTSTSPPSLLILTRDPRSLFLFMIVEIKSPSHHGPSASENNEPGLVLTQHPDRREHYTRTDYQVSIRLH
jgi:hypothetical protein